MKNPKNSAQPKFNAQLQLLLTTEFFLKAQGLHSFYFSPYPITGDLISLQLKYCPISSPTLYTKVQSHFFNCLNVIYTCFQPVTFNAKCLKSQSPLCWLTSRQWTVSEEDGNPTEIQRWFTFAHTVEFPGLKSSEMLRQRQMWQQDGELWESGIRKLGPQQKEQERGRCLINRVRQQDRAKEGSSARQRGICSQKDVRAVQLNPMFSLKRSDFHEPQQVQISLRKEYFLSNKEALVPSLLPGQSYEVPHLGNVKKKKGLRVCGGLALPPEASENSFALISRSSIKMVDAIPPALLVSGKVSIQRWHNPFGTFL